MRYKKVLYDNQLRTEDDRFYKKTLVFYINSIHDGGAERVIVNLTKCFAEDGYNVILVTSFKAAWEYEISPLVKRVVIEQQESRDNVVTKNIKRIYALRKVCKTEKADILISFMAEPNIRAIIASMGLKTKTIISVRSDPDMEYAGLLGKLVKRYLLTKADGCVFQTKYAKEMFSKKLQDKSTIIYNMIKDEFYHIKVTDPKYIVSCGRLDKIKNYEMLIRAYARLNIEHCPQLRIYGQGSEKENLENLIRELDLEERVLLCGQVDDVASVLKEAKLFVLTSNSEGMPNALMEAMAAGIPCIATDCPCGGPREIFGAELENMLIPVNDIEALVGMLSDTIKNENIKSISDKTKMIAQMFTEERIFEEWKKLIESDSLHCAR